MNIHPQNSTYHRKLRGFLIDLNIDLMLIDEKMKNIYVFESDEYNELHFYVMALEDRRFLNHKGIDYKSFIREFLKFISFQKHGGASTIDMQMVRTLTNFKEKTFFRKLYEMTLAYIVNFRYSKKQIIECYLKYAFFGSGLIGIEKVLPLFCVTNFDDLEDKNKAIIASFLQRPRPLNPDEIWVKNILARASYAQKMRCRVKNSKY